MNVAGSSVTGPRDHNEDMYYYKDFSELSHFPEEIWAFIMLCDGMGGYQGGDIASQAACEAAKHYIDSLVEIAAKDVVTLDVPQALREIIDRANQAICLEMQQRENQSMGATFVGAFISPSKVWIAHVGDSRAYLIRRGRAEQLTEDHSEVGRMLAQGVISEEEAQVYSRRNVIEKALGFGGSEEAGLLELSLERGDAILLCSDGVSTVLNSEVIADAVVSKKSITDAVNALTDKALQMGTDDNSTAILAVRDWGTFKARSPKKSLVTRLKEAQSLRQKATAFIGAAMIVAAVGVICIAQEDGEMQEQTPDLVQLEEETSRRAQSVEATESALVHGELYSATYDSGEHYEWRILSESTRSPIALRYISSESEEGSAPVIFPLSEEGGRVTFRPDASELIPGVEVDFAGESNSFIRLDRSFWRQPAGSGMPPILLNLDLDGQDADWFMSAIEDRMVSDLFVIYTSSFLEKAETED